MNLSHSKLNCILTCPASYYLRYKVGINLKFKKPALSIGSAVHWGIEHNTFDLTEYWLSDEGKKAFPPEEDHSKDIILAESIVYGYLKHKDELFNEILTVGDKKLELVEELHELTLTAKLPSFSSTEDHGFLGIIDLLLLTNEGFILVDYKTSSQIPDWDKYLDQIYRYIYLLRTNFPDVPIVKIGVVNLRKASIRQRKNETDEDFFLRLREEYELNDENYINYHGYIPGDLNQELLNDYINNLSKQADMAQLIDDNNIFFINYDKAIDTYGKSDYYDIFYHTPDAFKLYDIKDNVYIKELGITEKVRDCVPIDMLVIENKNILNKYETFKANTIAYYATSNSLNKKEIFDHLKKSYICDDSLLEIYWDTLTHEVETDGYEELKKAIS